jgi:diguanylate cyclase (GGDEF)-like protein
MGTTDVLMAAALVAVALMALTTFATARARRRADKRLENTLDWIGSSVTRLTETMATVAERTATADPTAPLLREFGTSLDIHQLAESIAAAAIRIHGVDGVAFEALGEAGEKVTAMVGIPDATAVAIGLDPPDDVRWDAAQIFWRRDRRSANVFSAAVALPLLDADTRLGTLLALTHDPNGFEPETETALARLTAAARQPLVNARHHLSTLDLVRTDALTGLRNRRAYDEDLALEIERARRADSTLSLLLIDLDDFGQVNKWHSLEVGDAVLQAFAEVLRSTARTVDVVCRRGGEEFAVVLPDTGCGEAQRFFDRLRHEVAFTQFPTIGRLTFSAGLTHLRPEDTPRTIDERTSRLLNESKRAGKDRVTHDCD